MTDNRSTPGRRPRIAVAYGTRPEFIKLVPVSRMMRSRGLSMDLISSGQHEHLLRPIYETFGVSPDVQLDCMTEGQSLAQLTAALFRALEVTFLERPYDYVVVQGDTTTALVAGMVAFYHKIPVGHVEAGLRTRNRYSPFPEELNRQMLTVLATHHFAPTASARQNLLDEGVDEASILVTGNTVIDALKYITDTRQADMRSKIRSMDLDGRQFVLMTMHRRENIGDRIDGTLRAVKDFLVRCPEFELVLPLHRNPDIRTPVIEILGSVRNAQLIEAQDYLTFCALMQSAAFIVTDSGGIQEEAPYFNRRTLVIRDTTERPEAIESGTAWLVGTDYDAVLSALSRARDEVMQGTVPDLRTANPFGVGDASEKICALIENRIAGGPVR